MVHYSIELLRSIEFLANYKFCLVNHDQPYLIPFIIGASTKFNENSKIKFSLSLGTRFFARLANSFLFFRLFIDIFQWFWLLIHMADNIIHTSQRM